MLRTRRHRLYTVLVAVLSLLFAQMALAGYVCPQQADVQSMAAMMQAGIPCEGMDDQQPALCHQHAADPGQTFETAKLPAVATPAIVQVLQLPLVLDVHATLVNASVVSSFQAWPPPEPLFLATLRLRV